MLRRLKKDVLKDLPPKVEQTVLIDLDEDHMAIYQQRRAELQRRVQEALMTGSVGQSTFMILQVLTELRRLASVPESDGSYPGTSTKRGYLSEMIDSLNAEGHKCLVFCNYLATVDLVSEDLGSRGIGNLVMTGATTDRQTLVRRFQEDRDIRAFVMTLKTGGVGLNLTAADYVFIVDPWWNRAAETQAMDRTHRIGQTRTVFSYRLIARGTIEERILELQERKADLAGAVLSTDTDMVKKLTAEDLEYLLGTSEAGVKKGTRRGKRGKTEN